jgi:16S rRNA (uracil1498-N3)-methyltransferase
MAPRLYLATALEAGMTVTLPADRAHYLRDVLRLRAGATLSVFDGHGREFDATFQTGGRQQIIAIGACTRTEPEPRLRLHLVQSMIKGDKLDFAVQKATELDVTDIWLAISQRSEVRLSKERTERRLRHWWGVAAAACEQCGRVRLPELHGPAALADVVAHLADTRMLLLDPGAPPLTGSQPATDTAVLIGPEGGFSDDERARLLAAGAEAVGLGARILRADTAPIAALAALRQGWGWQLP